MPIGRFQPYRRRARMISKAPASKANALAPEAGSISGTTARQALDIPTPNSAIPAIFIIKLVFMVWFIPTMEFYGSEEAYESIAVLSRSEFHEK